MTPSPHDDDKLLIRCPECRQRFKVEPELRGRMVECGVCEHRFHIRDEVIIRLRKFYPGEKRHHELSRFQRISNTQPANAPVASSEFSPFLPQPHAGAAAYQPVPPQRILAGLIGTGTIVAMALLMLFGSDHGGPLDGMVMSHKFLMAGFTALIGFSLILYANPNTRGRAMIFGTALVCGLMAVPYFIREGSSSIEEAPPGQDNVVPDPPPQVNAKSARDLALEAMRERAGIRPLEQEIELLAAENPDRQAFGLFLVGLHESNRIAVRDYMFRVTSAEPTSHIYPRDDSEYLFVLSGLDVNIERLASLASPLGRVREIFPELNLVEITVDNGVFVEPPSGTLIDRAHTEFYELNLIELRSIDLQRIQRAVMRISESEPKMFRVDISRRLRELLNEPGVQFHAAIARALRTWDPDVEGAASAANQTAIQLHLRGGAMPTEIIDLALENPTPELVPVLVDEWRKNTLMWENYCVEMGPIIEDAMIRELAIDDQSLKQSAARILGRIGGRASIPVLEKTKEGANPEMVVILNRALESIAARTAAE